MILIVESGSTKADWVVLDGDKNLSSFQTKGWNPLFLSSHEMILRLKSYLELKSVYLMIKELYFYTPGYSHSLSFETLYTSLKDFFVNAKVIIQSDMNAAARSVYKDKPLFVSILGTGSNTAFYDGEIIEQLKPSLGYVLGDEGSGASLGKELLKSYLYENLPHDLFSKFSKKHSISKDMVLKSVYKQDHANQFLASYVPFLVDHKSHVFVENLVQNEFNRYLNTHILSHSMCTDYSISFVGSVAFHFQHILRKLCQENKLKMDQIVQYPINLLTRYHINND